MDETASAAPSWWSPIVSGLFKVAGAYLAPSGSGAAPAPIIPTMSQSNPVSAGVFDGSGWAMNYGGSQKATSSPSNIVSPVVSAQGRPASTIIPGVADSTVLIGGALVLIVLLQR
jgi:hypothetical protein